MRSVKEDPTLGRARNISQRNRRQALRNSWACSVYTVLTTAVGLMSLLLMARSFLARQLDVKGCEMSYMRPMYARYEGFDTEHTRFAKKYSLYLYNEGGIDEDDFKVHQSPSNILIKS